MISPSPPERPQPSCASSPDTKPATHRLTACSTKLLRVWAKLHVSYRGGRYSVERLLALDEYTRNTSLLRVLLVCVATPLPMAVLVISQEAVPLQDPAAGWWVNYGYWIRVDILTVVVTHTLVVQAKFLVEGFAMSWCQVVLFVACSIVLTNISSMAVAAYWTFPIPFCFLVMSPSFYMQLLVIFYAIAGAHVIREMLAHKDQLIRYVKFVTAQELMAIIYPAYQVLFHAMVNTPYKLPVILFLPVIKLIVKNIVLRCVTHMEDMMPEAVIFTVDFFNALYLATCMESAASTTAVLIIVTTDLAQTATVLYGLYWRTATVLSRLRSVTGIPNGGDNLLTRAGVLCRCPKNFENQIRESVKIRSCLPHQLSTADRTLLGCLEKFPISENADALDFQPSVVDSIPMKTDSAFEVGSSARQKNSRICVRKCSTTVQPIVTRATTVPQRDDHQISGKLGPPPPLRSDAIQHTTSTEEIQPAENSNLLTAHSNILGETLEVLFTSECIMLTAYLETVIPVFYGNFMLIMVRLPSAKYRTDLVGVTAENVSVTVQTVFGFATLQLLSFVLLSTLIRRNLGMRALYQLAFVLETQRELIQSKLMTWALVTMAFRVVHFGIDFTFKFDWIGN